ncbi:MAG: thiamine pyrophosphate-binding protein [Bacillota bacterium]
MVRMTGGKAVVEALIREGVDTVFGIPGVHTMEIYDALCDRDGQMCHIVTRNEVGAGFMADGYARATGKVGVGLVITGPGVANAATALGQAYSDSSPLLLISSQNRSDHMDRDVGDLHQLKDQLGLTAACSAWSRRVTDPADVPGAISDAMAYLRTHRPRPVHIEIPTDVLSGEAEMNFSGPTQGEIFSPSEEEVGRAAALLLGAERPVIWAGGGSVGASDALREVAQVLEAPVIMTCAGKGVLDENHPLSLGCNLRSEKMREFVQSADVLLVVGSELSVYDTGDDLQFPQMLIRVDLDPPRGDRPYRPHLHIQSDAGIFAEQLLERLRGSTEVAAASESEVGRGDAFRGEIAQLRDSIREGESDDGEVRAIIDVLRQTLLPEDLVVCDMTMLCYRASSLYPAERPRTFLFPRGFGTLGWSMPAAIGAKLGRPDRNVLSINGDGGLMFTIGEFATAVKYRLPLPVMVLNNESYGVVERIQKRRFGREIGTDICNPDFVELAEAFGGRGRRLTDAAQLPSVLNEAFSADGPTIVEFRVDF